MKHTYSNSPVPRKRDWMEITLLVILLALFALAFEARAQEGSQGNTTIFGSAEMTFFGNHDFVAPAGGTQPGIILTERATATISYLNFKGNGITSSGATDVSHVDGYVRKIGTGKFVFPVGNNGFVGQFAAGADQTNGAYFHADPSVAITPNRFTASNYPQLPAGGLPAFPRANKQAKVGVIDQVEYWDINGTNSTPITLTWDAGSGVTAMTASTLSRLTIVGWDPATSMWVNIPSAFDGTNVVSGLPTDLTAGSITTTGAIVPDNYTVYTLAALVPDLTPTLRITPSQVVGNNKRIEVRVVVAELNGVQTSGAIYVQIPVSPHYTINPYSPTLPASTGLPVQNTQWSYVGISGVNHVFKYGGTSGVTTINASTSSAFGFSIQYSANGQSGTDTMVSSIFDGSGGEVNFGNNKDNENINYSF